jgi:hypothetical protein
MMKMLKSFDGFELGLDFEWIFFNYIFNTNSIQTYVRVVETRRESKTILYIVMETIHVLYCRILRKILFNFYAYRVGKHKNFLKLALYLIILSAVMNRPNLYHFYSKSFISERVRVTVTVTKLWHRFPRSLRYLIIVLVINFDRFRLVLSVRNIKTECLF